jgi:hypothetical protein
LTLILEQRKELLGFGGAIPLKIGMLCRAIVVVSAVILIGGDQPLIVLTQVGVGCAEDQDVINKIAGLYPDARQRSSRFAGSARISEES